MRCAALLAAAVLSVAIPAAPVLACTPPMDGTRLESQKHVVAYISESISVGQHFSLELAACAKSGRTPQVLKVDAHMPQHRHGMNYKPTIKVLGPGRWRAEGLMFHMPGPWEFVFELDGERLAAPLVLSFFNEEEKRKILAHGPWPPPLRPDPGNRVSGKPEAIAFGEKLFFEPRLSGSGSVLCATCHAPFRHFQDGRARAFGVAEVDRNTPTVVNTRFYRWYGWDGAQDSLWAQSIRPLLEPKEMNASPAHVARTVRSLFSPEYRKAFGHAPVADDEALLADVGKALAAFQETLVSGRTAFDEFRDALAQGRTSPAYPVAAQRGLRIFVGKGNCSVCHFGPQFTNGEFADTGVKFFVAPGRVDAGRHAGIERLKKSPFTLLGRFNDDRSGANAVATKHVAPQHRNFGEFRVPGLRDVARTAPYMHNGSLASLREVVRFYSELDEERLHADGEKILKPLRLTDTEIDDLVAFLETL